MRKNNKANPFLACPSRYSDSIAEFSGGRGGAHRGHESIDRRFGGSQQTGTHGLSLPLSIAHDRTVSQAKSSAQVGVSLSSNLVFLTREKGLLKARFTLQ